MMPDDGQLRIVPKRLEENAKRNASIARALEEVRKMCSDGLVDGAAMAIVLKDGSNWTHISSIEDNVKMIGLLEMLKHDVTKRYLRAYE